MGFLYEVIMKKFILILVAVLIICSCKSGKNYRLPISEGDLRYTVTSEYIIVEECYACIGFGIPHWKLVRIEYKNDENKEEIECQY